MCLHVHEYYKIGNFRGLENYLLPIFRGIKSEKEERGL